MRLIKYYVIKKTVGLQSILKQNSAFTIIEFILAIFISTALIVGVTAFAAYYFQNYSFSFEENQSVGIAQQALTTLIREIREARISETGAWPIFQSDDNTIIFYGDVTNDGRSDRIRYFITGTNLKKGVIEPTQAPVTYPAENEKVSTVASYVDNAGLPLFKYYNGNWPIDQINNPLPINLRILNTRYISVYIRINVNSNKGAQPFDLKSGVQIRSMKDNL